MSSGRTRDGRTEPSRARVGLSEPMVLATNTVVFLSRQRDKRATVQDLEVALELPKGAPVMTDVLGRLAGHGLIEHQADGAQTVRLSHQAGPLPLARLAEAVGERLVVADEDAGSGSGATAAEPMLSWIWQEILTGLESVDVFSLAGARPV